MRPMIVPFVLVAAFPQVQRPPLTLLRTLTVTTARPRVDLGTTFKLSGTAANVNWDFGDGKAPQMGASTMTYTYRQAGTFTVKATVGSTTVQESVTVVEPRRVVATPVTSTPGKVVSLKLEEPFGTMLLWNFGDQSAPMNGGSTVTHTFQKEGDYTVTVRDSGMEPSREFKLDLPVGRQGPGAPFSVSYLALRWEDGAVERSVNQGETGLVAYADLKFEGTGQLQAEWIVDGQVQRAVSEQLGFAKLTTLKSGQTLASPLSTVVRSGSREGRHTLASTVQGEFQIPLPTNVAGEHKVTLKVLQPKLAFQVPVIRYFVKLGGESKGPVVQSLSPAYAKPGEEVELILTGTGFSREMTLNLGKDVAVLGAPQILSPEKAVVKVFIAPTAQPGARLFQARKRGGTAAGTAHLEIIPAAKFAGILVAKPGATPAVISPALPVPPPVVPPAALLSGSLPGGKPVSNSKFKNGLVEAVKPNAGLGLVKADDKGKKPLVDFKVPAGFHAPKVELAKVPKTGSGFAKFTVPGDGKGRGSILDSIAGQGKDKVIVCKDGQKLHLSLISLSTPSFEMIGVNSSGEFKKDDVPVLRDSTKFTWKEKNPGTSEYFELRFYNAKNGNLLKNIRVSGNRSSYDVSPAFVQELGQLRASGEQPVRAFKKAQITGGTSETAKASAKPSPKLSAVTAAGVHRSGSKISKPDVSVKVPTAPSGQVPGMAPDPDIPAAMGQKADVVWQVVGFRNYPCLSAEDLAAQKKAQDSPVNQGEKPTPVLNFTPVVVPLAVQRAESKPLKNRRGIQVSTTSAPVVQATAASSPVQDKLLTGKGQASSKVGETARLYQSVAAEVSRSGVWPLNMPTTAQGISPAACTISPDEKSVMLKVKAPAPKITLVDSGGGKSKAIEFVEAAGGSKPAINLAGSGGGKTSGLTLGATKNRDFSVSSSNSNFANAGIANSSKTVELRYFTFDEFELYGTFDLTGRVPYRLLPAVKQSKIIGKLTSNQNFSSSSIAAAIGSAVSSATPPTGSVGNAPGSNRDLQTTDQITFKNVFVDWGDGTIEPFRAKPTAMISGEGESYYGSYRVEPGDYHHVYTRPDTYRVKVFVLSDEDMVRGGIVGEVAKALTPTQSLQGVFTRLSEVRTFKVNGGTGQGGKLSALTPLGGKAKGSTAPTGLAGFGANAGKYMDMLPSASQALGRAFVVYCQERLVENRTDPCSLLPLHLISAHLEFTDDKAEPQKGSTKEGGSRSAQKTQPIRKEATTPGRPAAVTSQSAIAADKYGLAQTAPGTVAKAATTPVAPSGPNLPSTTTCNLFYSAKTRIKYYGQGLLQVTWRVDGQVVGSQQRTVMSPQRKGLKAGEDVTCTNPMPGEDLLDSPAFPVDSLGNHVATVEAYVLSNQSGDMGSEDLARVVEIAKGGAPIAPLTPQLTHILADASGVNGSSKPKVKFGLLNPTQAPGQPAFVQLNLDKAAGVNLHRAANGALQGSLQLGPPFRVEAKAAYQVKVAPPGAICNFYFPTKGGIFPITNLSNLKLTPDQNLQRASGKGLLVFGLKSGTSATTVREFPLDVTFSDWMVDDFKVAKGKIEIVRDHPFRGQGIEGKLTKVRGEIADKNVLQDIFATLELKPIDTTMVLTSGGKGDRPTWTAEAPVTTKGDWIATNLTLEKTKLGPTPWVFSAKNVTIDLSSLEGVGPKGGNSPSWVGVSLGTVTLFPTVIEEGGTWPKGLPEPTDWVLEGLGVKGAVDVGPWEMEYRQGKMTVGKIHFEGKGQTGDYSATYSDVVIRSPWFKDPIRVDASIIPTGNGYKLNLNTPHAGKWPTFGGGPMSVEPKNLQFNKVNGEWMMQGKAHIALQTEQKGLTDFTVDGVGFGLDGLMYFGDNGLRSFRATLNRPSNLGPTPADLVDAVLTGSNGMDAPLNVRVNANLHLSDNPVIPIAPVTMDFALKTAGSSGIYLAPEVKVSPFSMDVAFPIGSPSMTAKINTNYKPGGTAGGAPAMASNRFSGEVDLSMFGGSPVKAQFVLGYANGKDYFATRVDVPLGPSGIVIYPEVVSLFRLSGGFAYNFGQDVFQDGGSITNAKPDFKGTTQFLAGARLGSADGFIYTLDGQLVVNSSGVATMNFFAWLAAHNPSGNAPLHGRLEYANGNFDGALWGKFTFLGDVVSVDLGNEGKPAGSLHFGGAHWHIYAGDKNGSRINLKLLNDRVNGYLMLGDQVGFCVGGGQEWSYTVGGSAANAWVKGGFDLDLQIKPSFSLVGDATGRVSAGACLKYIGCLSMGADLHVHAQALPIKVSLTGCIHTPEPFDDICF